LRHLARTYPVTAEAFGSVSGVGQRKKEELAAAFIEEIRSYLKNNDKMEFEEEEAPPAWEPASDGITPTASLSLQLFREGRSIEEIAAKRGLATSTITGHIALAVEAGEEVSARLFYTEEEERIMAEAFSVAGFETLSAAKERVGDRIDYGKLRFYRAMTRRSCEN
jgi:ATP-dependent DNA helicase RecQ